MKLYLGTIKKIKNLIVLIIIKIIIISNKINKKK